MKKITITVILMRMYDQLTKLNYGKKTTKDNPKKGFSVSKFLKYA
jgi:hypothetical protein